MVGAFKYTIVEFMDGDNSIHSRTESRTCAYYTREAVLWTTSLAEVEYKRPWTLDRVKLIAIDDLLRLFLRHCVWFA
jgi:hypothetical protein